MSVNQKLPDEQLLKLFSYFPVDELVSAQRVCSGWRAVALDKSLWKNFTLTLSGGQQDRKYIRTMPALRNIDGDASNDLVRVILESLTELVKMNCKFEPPLTSSQTQSMLEKYPELQSICLDVRAPDLLESVSILKTNKNLKEVIFTAHRSVRRNSKFLFPSRYSLQAYSAFLSDEYFTALTSIEVTHTHNTAFIKYSNYNGIGHDGNDYGAGMADSDESDGSGDSDEVDGRDESGEVDGRDDNSIDDDDDDCNNGIFHNYFDGDDNDVTDDDDDDDSVMSDKIKKRMLKLSSLKLTFVRTPSKEATEAISMCTELHKLQLSFVRHFHFDFPLHIRIENMSQLRSLHINAGIYDNLIPVLCDSFRRSSWLHLREASFIVCNSMPKMNLLRATIENMRQLRKLRYCVIKRNTSENELENIGNMPHLEKLVIDGLQSFTEKGASYMSQCKNLKYFLLHARRFTIDDYDIANIMKSMMKLERMVLSINESYKFFSCRQEIEEFITQVVD